MTIKVEAYPYPFPLEGGLSPARTALAVIDFQIDFCGTGGYMDRMGIDLAPMRAAIAPTARLLELMRAQGYTVVHTRETFKSDLSDVQPHRLYRGPDGEAIVVGDEGPLGRCLIHGEPCWEIVPELAPVPGEAVFDKSAYGAFSCTDIGSYLESRGIRDLVFAGLTSNCCIQSNLREALDRGFECLVLEDCCGASSVAAHEQSMALIRNPAGVFGALSSSAALSRALGGGTGDAARRAS